jgi:tryptophanyl-tRNA synthetase
MPAQTPVVKSRKVMLSAVQPTNRLTLGNYLGALKNWVKLQKEYDCIFFAVDLHAITARQDPQELREATLLGLATYIAAGIDPKEAILFVQSHVPEHAELAWVLNCFAYMGELERMTQYKEKAAKQGASIPAGIFNYPVLMAADILLYQTDLVPVGADQKQHIELTRDIAIRMNNSYSAPLFTVPEPYISKVGARIMSLTDPTAKMSKSDPDPASAVYLADTDDQIRKKLKRAVTDSGSEIAFDPEGKPGVSNLLSIQACITGKPIADLVASYSGKQYGHLKVDTAELVVAELAPVRAKIDELMKDRTYLSSVLRDGAQRARERARLTLGEVYRTVGFLGA